MSASSPVWWNASPSLTPRWLEFLALSLMAGVPLAGAFLIGGIEYATDWFLIGASLTVVVLGGLALRFIDRSEILRTGYDADSLYVARKSGLETVPFRVVSSILYRPNFDLTITTVGNRKIRIRGPVTHQIVADLADRSPLVEAVETVSPPRGIFILDTIMFIGALAPGFGILGVILYLGTQFGFPENWPVLTAFLVAILASALTAWFYRAWAQDG